MAKFFVFLIMVMMASTSMGRWVYNRTFFGDTIDKISMKILKEAYESSPSKNVVVSPLGVLLLLALYGSGSEGTNRNDIMNFLGFTDYNKLLESYNALSQTVASMDCSYLCFANKVFVSDKYTLDDDFYKTALSFKCEAGYMNFLDPSSAAHIMNDWASYHTEEKISHPVHVCDIVSVTAVALLNVISFKGHWLFSFNPSDTKERVFYTANAKSVKMPMMHLSQPLYYYEDKKLGARIIELPYVESYLRMIVILPDEQDGLSEVVKKVSEKGILEDVFRLSEVKVHLDMLKFEIKSKHIFNGILSHVRLASIFYNESHGIVKDAGVKINKILQEAFVTVDEGGTSGGTVEHLILAGGTDSSHSCPTIPFQVDHPFLFAILKDDIVLFAGTYAN